MKKGISVEFDYSDCGYIVRKNRGKLTVDEIIGAINELACEGFYFIGINTENAYDDNGYMVEEAKGDFVKAYSYDAIKEMFRNGKE